MTTIRSAMLASALMMTMGNKRNTMTKEAMNVRVSLCSTESENIVTLGSLEMSNRGCGPDAISCLTTGGREVLTILKSLHKIDISDSIHGMRRPRASSRGERVVMRSRLWNR